MFVTTHRNNQFFILLKYFLLCNIIFGLSIANADQIFRNGFEDRALLFPRLTSNAQEAVENDIEASAAAIYGDYVSVNLSSGEVWLDRTDLIIPGRGQIQFEFTRRYRSQLNYEGPMGYGWDFKYNERLKILDDGSIIRSNGQGHLATWIKNVDSSFTSPVGYFSTLTEEIDGSYILREPDGFKHYYDVNGILQQHQDRFENSLVFSYDSNGNLITITDAFGRDYELDYQYIAGRNRLIVLRDFSGREIIYSYDENGDLISVRTPTITGTSNSNNFLSGRTENYNYYDPNALPLIQHNLKSVTYPQEVDLSGPVAIDLVYGQTGFDLDHATAITAGGTNASGIPAGGTTSITYTELNSGVPLGDVNVHRLEIFLLERNGTSQTYLFNELSHHLELREHTQGLRPGEPINYYQTVYQYDTDGQLTQALYPEGNALQLTYDNGGSRAEQNNLLENRRIADIDRGGGEDLVNTMTYEPIFNQPMSKTDARGNATAFVPPLGVATAARYTTLYFYDYQENNDTIPDVVKYGIDISGMTRNLGDINQDGITNQLVGNNIRIEEPTVTLRAASNQATSNGSTDQIILNEIQWNNRGQRLAKIDQAGNILRYDYYPENDPDGDGITIIGQSSTLSRGYLSTKIEDSLPASNRRIANVPPAHLTTQLTYDTVGNVITILNPRGIMTTIEYNQLNEIVVKTSGSNVDLATSNSQLLTGEAAFAYQHRYYYDENGRLILKEVENRVDVSTTAGVGDWVEYSYSYDILNNLLDSTIEIDDSTMALTSRSYDANDNLILKIKPEGNQISMEYDERNLLFKVHNGFGSTEVASMQRDYDLNGNQVRYIDAQDNDLVIGPETTTYVYDGFDRKMTTIDALGNQASWSFYPVSNVIGHQINGHRANLPNGGNVLLKSEHYFFDELNRLYQSDQELFLADGFNPLRPESLNDDNSDGRVTEYSEFDGLSNKTHKTEDDGDTHQYIFDGINRIIASIDPLNNQVQYTYDANSNVVNKTETDVSDTTVVADEVFNSYFVYDQLDRIVRSTDNAGRTTRYQYDSRNNLTGKSDAQNLLLITDPLSVFPGTINEAGNTTQYLYDGRDLRITEIQDLRVGGTGDGIIDTSNASNPDGKITVQHSFDLNDRNTVTTDDNNNSTTYVYDALDRKIQQINADTTVVDLVYDRDGNLTQITDANGSVISNSYDGINRLIQRDIIRGTAVIGTTQETYAYDGLSRLTQSVDNNGNLNDHQVDRIYDSLGRTIEEQQDFEPYSNVLAGDGRRLMLLYPTSRILEYSHDALNRVTEVFEPFPSLLKSTNQLKSGSPIGLTVLSTDWMGAEYCCEACPCDSRPLYIAMGNDTAMSFLDSAGLIDVGYSSVREPIALQHIHNGTEFIDRSYTYNREYMRVGELMTDIAGAPNNLYGLDSAYRSQSTLVDDFGGETFTQLSEYNLDGVGNRVTVDFTQDFGGAPIMFSETYSPNNMNEYDDASGGGGGPRMHDNNGNLIDASGFFYLYDFKNRLVEVQRKSDNALRAQYHYDTFNRRVRRMVFVLANATIEEQRRYIYDGLNVIEEWASDDDYNNNGPIYSYVFGAGIDQPSQMEASVSAAVSGKFWFHRDARNNVLALTNEAGDVVEKSRYDDFGNFDQTISIENRYLFQGRRYDPETGLFYYRNRYYDPVTGRFLQRDPVWDNKNKGNAYTFVANNPLSGRDPTGLVWWNPFSWPDDYQDWKTASDAAKARKLIKEAKSLKDAIKSAKDGSSLTKRVGDLLKKVAKKPLRGTGADPIGLMIQIDESLEVVAENSKDIGEKIKLGREIEESKHKVDPNFRLPMSKNPLDWCVLDWLYYNNENKRRKEINDRWDKEAQEAEEADE
ncbi:MAG: hypothetical protein JKY19_03320 [Alcanivoracaceae bacterium]|nr:hypothetical protein [Alcanivoracaceae bacterium]